MLSFFNDADGYTAVSGFTRGPNGEVLPPEASGQVHVLDRIRFAGRQVRAHDLMIVLNDVGFTLQAPSLFPFSGLDVPKFEPRHRDGHERSFHDRVLQDSRSLRVFTAANRKRVSCLSF
jgi:hypothetical protein